MLTMMTPTRVETMIHINLIMLPGRRRVWQFFQQQNYINKHGGLNTHKTACFVILAIIPIQLTGFTRGVGVSKFIPATHSL